jgi:ribosomal protein S12 methylthiotransferase
MAGEKAGVTAKENLPGTRPLLSPPGSAYVKISEGCDNHCGFCAIPLIRGRLRSRDIQDITEECKSLLGRGIKELCLIGQDLGSYSLDCVLSPGLPGLMESLSRLEGDFWVRLLYIHPDHFPMPILDIMEKDKRFLPYFDIPFQHASEKILFAMNRRGNAETYLNLIATIRRRFTDAVVRSTFMTGFPGETDEDFSLLLDFQTKAGLDWLGCFAYSREENTLAWTIKGRVAKKTAEERKRLVEEQQITITEKQMERFIGRRFDVLVEEEFEPIVDETLLYLGRLPFQAPEVDGAAVILCEKPLGIGVKAPCLVTARTGFDLKVRPV